MTMVMGMNNPLQTSKVRITARLDNNLQNVPALMSEYEEVLDQLEADDYFTLTDKSLMDMHRDYASIFLRFKTKLTELDVIYDFVQTERNKIRSGLWKRYTEGYSRALTDRQIERYIEGEDEYLTMHKILLEVSYLRNQFRDRCETLDKMSFRLKDFTTLQVEGMKLAVM